MELDLILKLLVGAATLMLTGLGVMSMFAPRKMIGNFAIEPIGVPGLSTIRSVIGGLFLSCVVILAHELITGETMGFVVVSLILGAVAIGRVVSIIADGLQKEVVPPLIVEIVIIAVLMSAHSNLAMA